MAAVWMSEVMCVELLGAEKAQAFIEQFGGACLYIPHKPARDHRIAQTVGLIGMATLCREYGGLNAEITNARQGKSKKTRIMELLEQGVSAAKVAACMGVSERYVYMVKKNYGLAKDAEFPRGRL